MSQTIFSTINHTGMKTSLFKEYGFNAEDFNQDKYKFYDAEDIIANRDADYTTIPSVSIIEPDPFEDVFGIQVGSSKNENLGIEERKGFFCEKPSLPTSILCDGSYPAYFYPLGTSGGSLDPIEFTRGFDYEKFSKGSSLNCPDKEDIYSTIKGVERSAVGNESFDSSSNYDRDCFFSYEGAHVRNGSENLLKFENSSNLSSSSKEKYIKKGEYLSYDLSSDENSEKIRCIKITDITDLDKPEEFNDYYVTSNLQIKSNSPIAKDSDFKIEIYYHNYWEDCNNKEGRFSRIYHNFLNTPDGFKVKASNNDYVFEKAFTVKENGFYTFSLYAKRDFPWNKGGESYLRGLHFIKGTDNSFSSRCSSGNGSKYYFISEFDKSIKDDSTDNIATINIDSTWKKYASCTYLSTGDYKAIFIWPKEAQVENDCLEIMGISVELLGQGLPTFNRDDILYTNIPYKKSKKHVLSLRLQDFSMDNNWVLSYLKKIDDFKEFESAMYNRIQVDSIGKYSFGYKNTATPIVGPSEEIKNLSLSSSSQEDIKNNRCNFWDQVIIEYYKNEKTLRITYKGEGDQEVQASTYTQDISLSDEDIKLLGTESFLDSNHTINFNLILGGYLANDEINLCNGTYRDVMWFPKGLGEYSENSSNSGILNLKSNFLTFYIEKGLDLEEDLGILEDEFKEWKKDNLIVKSPFLFERTEEPYKG